MPPLPRQQKATSVLRRLCGSSSACLLSCTTPTKRAEPSGACSAPIRSTYTPGSGPVSSTEEPFHRGHHLISHFDPSRLRSSALGSMKGGTKLELLMEITVELISYLLSIWGLLYLGKKMALWRKFSKTFKKTRSSFSRSFSSDVFWQAQHGPFSAPARSDLVGLVLSSISVSSVAGIRIGIFSSVLGENKSVYGRTSFCITRAASNML